MSKAAKAILLSVSVVLVSFSLIGGHVKAADKNSNDAYHQLGVYSEVLSRIRSEYVEEPNMSSVTDGALHGLLESLDAESSYLTPAEYQQFKSHKVEGRAGIGATVSKRFGYAAVVSVIPNGPADKAGLDDSDILESIEGKSTRELSLAEIHEMLAGQPGTTVTTSVVRARRAEPVKVVLTREMVQLPPVGEKMLEDGIGYVQPFSLVPGRAQEIAAKIKNLQASGAKKLILDLRDVSDGEESEGVATANLLLNHGTIAYLEGQKFTRQTFSADPRKAVISAPLVVLVNRGAAGPAEIVASAVLENGRGDVVGDKTFGTGSVQKTIEMADGSALILSVAKYYSPSGKALQDTAVTPNVLVADKDDDSVAPEDEDNTNEREPLKKDKTKRPDDQLRRAIDLLKNGNKDVQSGTPNKTAGAAPAPPVGNPLTKPAAVPHN